MDKMTEKEFWDVLGDAGSGIITYESVLHALAVYYNSFKLADDKEIARYIREYLKARRATTNSALNPTHNE